MSHSILYSEEPGFWLPMGTSFWSQLSEQPRVNTPKASGDWTSSETQAACASHSSRSEPSLHPLDRTYIYYNLKALYDGISPSSPRQLLDINTRQLAHRVLRALRLRPTNEATIYCPKPSRLYRSFSISSFKAREKPPASLKPFEKVQVSMPCK